MYPEVHINQQDGTFKNFEKVHGYRSNVVVNTYAFLATPGMSGFKWTSAAWGDFDADGDLDLLVGTNGNANFLYRNDLAAGGIMDSVTGTSLTIQSGLTHSVAWGDLDGDGDLDAIIGNGDESEKSSPNEVHINNGDGTFTIQYESEIVCARAPPTQSPRSAQRCASRHDTYARTHALATARFVLDLVATCPLVISCCRVSLVAWLCLS